ncbi:hypothetical protein SEMRO_1984_G309350.1 [Seminavis robusta]|uniref:Uncharacterized protein n=1 Tax=Seminavis robusta TaxID=568900 RepID=A0A9N8HWI9_9STRA|nr:hypothetical protein SEMRO_1984_G309350.1 [Seminavis robusta]|eukprot:Sro1984_g309350.1 n/a (101) ;mRNA; f:11041-11423
MGDRIISAYPWYRQKVPRLLWHVANLQGEAKQKGRGEDSDSSEEADGVAAMKKSATNTRVPASDQQNRPMDVDDEYEEEEQKSPFRTKMKGTPAVTILRI